MSSESISSMKITEGASTRATANSARTSFSPSPIHLLVIVDAEMLKNVDLDCAAMALQISVLPCGQRQRTALAVRGAG